MIKNQYIDGDYNVIEYESGTIIRTLISTDSPPVVEPIPPDTDGIQSSSGLDAIKAMFALAKKVKAIEDKMNGGVV